MGHAEPASGIAGVFHAAAALRMTVDLPIMHLGRMNDHAIGVLGLLGKADGTVSSEAGGNCGGGSVAVRAPRQTVPRPHFRYDEATALGEVAGVSAFAFQVRGSIFILQNLMLC